ncbi:hypothetical protein TSUD_416220 [Trifolium subterraneum]|uniref:Uncharacterized protein n=1 Tax=Trifolium subterraneum TaxID=3900 RepID=A0A2Z6PV71_TRISU|nr:hypothetical protein TSUD_416220 [Trifolium subterraneum]
MLQTFPEILEPAESFTHINLTNTAIKDLPSSLEHLVGLQRLKLKLCSNLVSLPNSIVKLSLLSHLDCSGCCRLTEIPNNIGCLSSLTELSLQGSSIVNLPESMVHLSVLKSLDLTDCKRLAVPNNIGCLSSLTKLSLEGSSIVNLPESMAHLSSLKSLNLSGCKLLESVLKLPPNLNQVSAFDCPSIKKMVLNSRSNSREGIFKFHLTNNQEIDAAFWSNIGEEVCIKITDKAYWPVVFCFPGSVVPRWFHYCCKGHSVTMEKVSPNLLIGFALCVVLGPEEDMYAMRIGKARVMYKFGFISDGEMYSYDHCYMPEGISNWSSQDRFINQDHTLIWKHQLNLRIDMERFHDAHSFTFEILDDDDDEPCFLTRIQSSTVKECGICPLYIRKKYDDSDHDESFFSPRIQSSTVKECGISSLHTEKNDDDEPFLPTLIF